MGRVSYGASLGTLRGIRHRAKTAVCRTVTKTVGEVSIPLGIVLANHGEILPDVDERLSARFGLTFDLTPNKKD